MQKAYIFTSDFLLPQLNFVIILHALLRPLKLLFTSGNFGSCIIQHKSRHLLHDTLARLLWLQFCLTGPGTEQLVNFIPCVRAGHSKLSIDTGP